MYEFLPILIVGAIIGAFTMVFVIAYIAIGKVKTGALIVIEDEIVLDEYIRTGIDVDAIVSSQLLLNICWSYIKICSDITVHNFDMNGVAVENICQQHFKCILIGRSFNDNEYNFFTSHDSSPLPGMQTQFRCYASFHKPVQTVLRVKYHGNKNLSNCDWS